jgi:hypothetical protein
VEEEREVMVRVEEPRELPDILIRPLRRIVDLLRARDRVGELESEFILGTNRVSLLVELERAVGALLVPQPVYLARGRVVLERDVQASVEPEPIL